MHIVVEFSMQELGILKSVLGFNELMVFLFIGWQYEVIEPQNAKFKPKSYAANFSWDKKTRVATK